MRWPKEEGSDFAGHHMAKKSDPLTGPHWPKGRGGGKSRPPLPTPTERLGELANGGGYPVIPRLNLCPPDLTCAPQI